MNTPLRNTTSSSAIAGVGQHGAALLRQADVDFLQREVGVEHAENLHAGGMSMTGGVGTGGLIFDRSDDAEHARMVVAINAEAVGALEQGERLGLLVTSVAGFGILIDGAPDLRGQRWNS